jgi:hypothetical protein
LSQPPRQAAVTSSLAPDATDHGGDAHRHPFLDRRHEHWLLASMLLVLHTALDSGIDTQLASALMVTHLGLFFLWQPIWQREQRVDLPALAVTLMLVGAMLWLTWWTVFAWLVLLIGILAGRSFSTRRERYVYMLSLAMLVSELLINCTAQLFLAKPLAPGITPELSPRPVSRARGAVRHAAHHRATARSVPGRFLSRHHLRAVDRAAGGVQRGHDAALGARVPAGA